MDSFTCMTCQKKTTGEPVMVHAGFDTKVGLCAACARTVYAFDALMRKVYRQERQTALEDDDDLNP